MNNPSILPSPFNPSKLQKKDLERILSAASDSPSIKDRTISESNSTFSDMPADANNLRTVADSTFTHQSPLAPPISLQAGGETTSDTMPVDTIHATASATTSNHHAGHGPDHADASTRDGGAGLLSRGVSFSSEERERAASSEERFMVRASKHKLNSCNSCACS